MAQTLAEWLATSALSADGATYVESLYDQYLGDASSVSAEWHSFFTQLAPLRAGERSHAPVIAAVAARTQSPPRFTSAAPAAVTAEHDEKQGAVSRLTVFYANRGHLIAQLDPLQLAQRPRPSVLTLENVGLTPADLDTEFYTGSRSDWLPKRATLREIVRRFEQVYCGTIGAEFAHVSDTDERIWLQDEFQRGRTQDSCSADEQRSILWQLTAAEGLERYLHTRYVGQKRFSLEGGEALIAALDLLVQDGGSTGIEEVIIGMPHRGRLNVLVNVLGKSPGQLFSEFEGKYEHLHGSGDVKYHKGFSADLRTPGGNVHVALAFNPSHLEIVNPVVEGSVRARQERRGDGHGGKVLPVLMHGDAAFAGQGVVMETLQLSQTRGYGTGGTIHIVVNNQVGFTMSEPTDARSTMYCSDVAKMIEAPILHVNGDDPEAVLFVARLALRYRQRFHKDIVIDLVCYRRLGHNESDEPAATQPTMYKVIRAHATTRKLYAERLVAAGVIAAGDADKLFEQYRAALDEGKHQLHPSLGMIGNQYTVDWSKYVAVDSGEPVATAVEANRLAALGRRIIQYPQGFTLHPRVAQVVVNRAKMLAGEQSLDWGCAETLAYASLLEDGFPVRLSGQDCGRGTFFHRHAVFHDQNTGARHIPLQHIKDRQPDFTVIDSLLSEEAVLGFEYGYASTSPDHLVIWEGQFGDFVNGAQVLIDQFISSGTTQRPHAVPAARLRRPGPGTFLRAPRALPAVVRREQHAGVRAVDTRADVPHAAPADAAAIAQAADRDDAQEPAAPRTVGVAPERARDRPLPARHRRSGWHQSVRGAARGVLQRQGLFRPAARAPRPGTAECRAGACRTTVSIPGGRVPARAGALSAAGRDRLVPGRAAEPGCLVPDPASAADARRRTSAGVLRRACLGIGAGHRDFQIA
jgi:2-oxoglutarate dehydrogenase E1 component